MMKVAASSAKASPAPMPSTRAVPSAGPASMDRFSLDEDRAFASWTSSSGIVCGTNPE